MHQFVAGRRRTALSGDAQAPFDVDAAVGAKVVRGVAPGGALSQGAKDMSAYSFDDHTNIKHVMYDGTATARKDWHRTIFRGAAPTDQQGGTTSHD